MTEKEEGYITSSSIDVYYPIVAFYTMMDLELLLGEKGVKIVGFDRMFELYTARFARSIFDYLVVTGLGEARHAPMRAAVYSPQLTFTSDRASIYKKAHMFEPKSAVRGLIKIFGSKWKKSGYGGKPWLCSIGIAEKYGEISDRMFIDLAVNKQHNNGSVFGRKFVIFRCDMAGDLQRFLNFRRQYRLLRDAPVYGFELSVPRYAYPHFQYAHRELGVLSERELSFVKESDVELFQFVPKVNWGYVKMDVLETKGQEFKQCNECGRLVPKSELCKKCKEGGENVCKRCCKRHGVFNFYTCTICGEDHYYKDTCVECGHVEQHCVCKVPKKIEELEGGVPEFAVMDCEEEEHEEGELECPGCGDFVTEDNWCNECNTCETCCSGGVSADTIAKKNKEASVDKLSNALPILSYADEEKIGKLHSVQYFKNAVEGVEKKVGEIVQVGNRQ